MKLFVCWLEGFFIHFTLLLQYDLVVFVSCMLFVWFYGFMCCWEVLLYSAIGCVDVAPVRFVSQLQQLAFVASAYVCECFTFCVTCCWLYASLLFSFARLGNKENVVLLNRWLGFLCCIVAKVVVDFWGLKMKF